VYSGLKTCAFKSETGREGESGREINIQLPRGPPGSIRTLGSDGNIAVVNNLQLGPVCNRLPRQHSHKLGTSIIGIMLTQIGGLLP